MGTSHLIIALLVRLVSGQYYKRTEWDLTGATVRERVVLTFHGCLDCGCVSEWYG
jgi:hypothetical protein